MCNRSLPSLPLSCTGFNFYWLDEVNRSIDWNHAKFYRANGVNFREKWQKLTIYHFLKSKPHIDAVMLRITRLWLCTHDIFAITFALSWKRSAYESASRCVWIEFIVCSARRWFFFFFFKLIITETPKSVTALSLRLVKHAATIICANRAEWQC